MTAEQLRLLALGAGAESSEHLAQAPMIVKGHGQPDGVEAQHLHAVDDLPDVHRLVGGPLPEALWSGEPAHRSGA